MLRFFETILLSSEVGYRKPHKEIFNIALKELGVSPSEAMMVGNRITPDIYGGNNAGMTTVLLKWNDKYNKEITDEKMKPNYTVNSLEGLKLIL